MTDVEISKHIASECSLSGGTVYYVGGYVRDKLLQKENKDIDIEVHGIQTERLEEILQAFGKVEKVGASFGVYKVHGNDVDIALPRTERKVGNKHTDFDITVNPFLGEREASRRRDFTINCFMENVLTGDIFNFFNGKEDLEKGIIRHIDAETFVEDPLRVLRAAQFAARFDFIVAPETIYLCGHIDISSLPKERVFEETKKALLKAEKPSIFFETLREMDQLDTWFPELKALIGVQQNQIHHQEGDVWNHTMMVLDEAAKRRSLADNPTGLMFSALCHDFGKPATTFPDDKGILHSYGHEEQGMKVAKVFLNRLTSEAALHKYVENMILLHQQPSQKAEHKSRIKSTNKMFDRAVSPNDLLLLSEADGIGRLPSEYPEKKFLEDRLDLFNEMMKEPFVKGKDLVQAGLVPNKSFATVLEYAHKLRLAGVNKPSALKQTLAFAKKENLIKGEIGGYER